MQIVSKRPECINLYKKILNFKKYGRPTVAVSATIASRLAGCAAAKADFAQARSDRRRWRGWSEGTGASHQGWGEGRADGAVSMK